MAATATLLDLAPDGLAVSLISYGELYQGAYYARDPDAAMMGLREFLRGKEILPVTVDVMERFAIIRGQLPRNIRTQVGDMDVLIAATAIVNGFTLVTRNLSDFEKIPSCPFTNQAKGLDGFDCLRLPSFPRSHVPSWLAQSPCRRQHLFGGQGQRIHAHAEGVGNGVRHGGGGGNVAHLADALDVARADALPSR